MKQSELRSLIRECIQEVLAESTSGRQKPIKPSKSTKAKSPLKPDTSKKASTKTTTKPIVSSEPAQAKPPRPAKPGYKWVKSAMNGAWVEEAEGTPFFASVSSETYWSS